MTLCQKVVNTAGGMFLPGGEILRKSNFVLDGLNLFKSY